MMPHDAALATVSRSTRPPKGLMNMGTDVRPLRLRDGMLQFDRFLVFGRRRTREVPKGGRASSLSRCGPRLHLPSLGSQNENVWVGFHDEMGGDFA